jgi:hypothetical protein
VPFASRLPVVQIALGPVKAGGVMADTQIALEDSLRAPLWLARVTLPPAPLSLLRYECLAIALLCPILLSAALWNGFPIIFYDSGAYLLEGLGHLFIDERSPVYALFLVVASASVSLWLVVVLQAAMTAFVMTALARVEARDMSLWKLLGIATALAFGTSLPWYVGQIEPDILSGVVALTIYLLAFHRQKLGSVRSGLLVAVAAVSTAVHPSHLGLVAGLTICLALLRVAARFWLLPKPRLGLPAVGFALGLCLVLACNYAYTREVFVSRAGPVFLSARMMQDGIVKRLMDDTCPGSHYALCAYKDRFPRMADEWLWTASSPFVAKLGRFPGMEKESSRIVSDSLRGYPFANIRAALFDTAAQFVLLRTGDGIDPQEWVLDVEFKRFLPRQLDGYLAARQQRGEIHFGALNFVHLGVAILALLALGGVLWNGIAARQWRTIALPAFILLALLGNAFICGVLSGPHDRYQSRIFWTLPFVLLLTYAPKPTLRRPVESGT